VQEIRYRSITILRYESRLEKRRRRHGGSAAIAILPGVTKSMSCRCGYELDWDIIAALIQALTLACIVSSWHDSLH
jgi:hypothetical protein